MIRLAAMLCLMAGPAFPLCAFYQDITSRLSSGYGEVRAFRGLSNSGAMTEIWINPETGSWTALEVQPDFATCVVASGQAAFVVPRAPNL